MDGATRIAILLLSLGLLLAMFRAFATDCLFNRKIADLNERLEELESRSRR
jgi:hypothetical protein